MGKLNVDGTEIQVLQIEERQNAKCVKYHEVAMGGKIYSLRMAKQLSQEQLTSLDATSTSW